MNRYVVSAFSLLMLTACVETGLSSQQFFNIPDKDILPMQDKALHGDGQAAYDLSLFYSVTKQDFAKASYWVAISAKDGNPLGMYLYGKDLSESEYPVDQKEGRYWLQKAKESGDEHVAHSADSALQQLIRSDTITSACKTLSQTANKKDAIHAKHVMDEQLKIYSSDLLLQFRDQSGAILDVRPHQTDEVFQFYARNQKSLRYVAQWSGAATRSEEPEIKKWVLKNAPMISDSLATCFSWYVTKGRE